MNDTQLILMSLKDSFMSKENTPEIREKYRELHARLLKESTKPVAPPTRDWFDINDF